MYVGRTSSVLDFAVEISSRGLGYNQSDFRLLYPPLWRRLSGIVAQFGRAAKITRGPGLRSPKINELTSPANYSVKTTIPGARTHLVQLTYRQLGTPALSPISRLDRVSERLDYLQDGYAINDIGVHARPEQLHYATVRRCSNFPTVRKLSNSRAETAC